jgi:hypothetical protein
MIIFLGLIHTIPDVDAKTVIRVIELKSVVVEEVPRIDEFTEDVLPYDETSIIETAIEECSLPTAIEPIDLITAIEECNLQTAIQPPDLSTAIEECCLQTAIEPKETITPSNSETAIGRRLIMFMFGKYSYKMKFTHHQLSFRKSTLKCLTFFKIYI